MSIMRYKRVLAASLLCVGMLAGCTNQHQDSEAAGESGGRLQQPETIVVSKGAITPTISTRTDITQQVSFVVTLPERGSFKGNVKAGQNIAAGSVIGWNNTHELKSELDAKVLRITSPNADLPKNYAVIELQYDGFGLLASAKPLLKNADIGQLTGKFQVAGGVGPTDCQQIVRAATSSANSSTDSQNAGADTDSQRAKASLDQVACIIGKGVEVAAGEQANLVIAGMRRENVVVLPVSAVAGRISKGKVAKVVNGKLAEVAVGLGVTDGARIEITSGLHVGDKVSVFPPDIDPRRQ